MSDGPISKHMLVSIKLAQRMASVDVLILDAKVISPGL